MGDPPCESSDTADGGVSIAVDGAATVVREAFADVRVAGPYLEGYARALQRDAVLEHGGGGRMTIRFPPPEMSRRRLAPAATRVRPRF